MEIRSTLCLLSCALSVGACRSRSKGDDHKVPQSETVELTGAAQKQLDDWKALSVKNCDASAIFGGDVAATTDGDPIGHGIDAAWLFSQLKGRPHLMGAQGEWFAALLPQAFSGEGKTSYRASLTVNSSSSGIEASTKYSGTTCEVFVGGKNVARQKMYARLGIVEAWNSAKTLPVESALGIDALSTSLNRMRPYLDRIEAQIGVALSPDDQDTRNVANTLGLSEGEVEVVRADESVAVYTFPDIADLTPASAGEGFVLG